jgi:hypothetical protein
VIKLQRSALVHNGTADLTTCNRLKVLDLSGNRLTTLPIALPRPSSVTHLLLADNQIAATGTELAAMTAAVPTVAVFSATTFNEPVLLSFNSYGWNGGAVIPFWYDSARVTPPTNCRLGAGAPQCTLTLQLVDRSLQPVTVGGQKPHLTLRTRCETYPTRDPAFFTAWSRDRGWFYPIEYTGRRNCQLMLPMTDNGDGSYTAVIPPSWAPTNGDLELLFGFFDGDEQFWPVCEIDGTYMALMSLLTPAGRR